MKPLVLKWMQLDIGKPGTKKFDAAKKLSAEIYFKLTNIAPAPAGSSQLALEMHSLLWRLKGHNVYPVYGNPNPDCIALSTSLNNFIKRCYTDCFDIE